MTVIPRIDINWMETQRRFGSDANQNAEMAFALNLTDEQVVDGVLKLGKDPSPTLRKFTELRGKHKGPRRRGEL